jgi:hypothetical protein
MNASRRGRRRLDPSDTSVKVTVTLPSKQFDAYCAQARRDHLSLPEVIRRQLRPREAKNPFK